MDFVHQLVRKEAAKALRKINAQSMLFEGLGNKAVRSGLLCKKPGCGNPVGIFCLAHTDILLSAELDEREVIKHFLRVKMVL